MVGRQETRASRIVQGEGGALGGRSRSTRPTEPLSRPAPRTADERRQAARGRSAHSYTGTRARRRRPFPPGLGRRRSGLADRVNLKLSDFPTGWRAEEATGDNANRFDECGIDTSALTFTGRGASPNFRRPTPVQWARRENRALARQSSKISNTIRTMTAIAPALM